MKRRLDPEDHKPSLRDKIIGLGERSIRKSYFPQIQQQLEALRRMNRELRAVSNCNQTLMRAEDEQTLLNEICRIVCDAAGYRMAWVGYAEHDEGKTVRPLAWAGVEDGYLAAADITWAETERGRGPTGRAIRTGESRCIQDFSTDPSALPWREAALERGYRSSIALPLKDKSAGTFGALTIHSLEPNAFTPDEVRLLEELAGDLAFGITTLRARVERARAEQEVALLSFALNSVREAAFLIDEKAHFSFVNEEACRVLGYTREELLSLGVPDVDPDFPAERWPSHWNDLNTNRSLSFEGRHRKKDGLIFPVEINANYFEYGGKAFNLALVRDISERRRAEEALRESEKKSRQFVDTAYEGILAIDADGRTTFVNARMAEMLGYHADQMVNQSVEPFMFADDLADHASRMVARRQGVQEQYVRRWRHKGGEAVWTTVSAAPVFDAEHHFRGSFAMVTDITERRQAEEKLRTGHQQLLDIIDFLPDATFVIDRDKKVIAWNRAIEEMTGTRKEDILGQGDYAYAIPWYGERRPILIDLIGVEDSAFKSKYQYVKKQGRSLYAEFFVPSVFGGRGAHLWATASPLLDPHGNMVGAIESVRDITERKRAEEALRLSEEKFSLAFRASPDSISISRLQDGAYLEVNDGFVSRTGYTVEEVLGKTALDLGLWAWTEERERCARELQETGSCQGLEAQFRMKDGSLITGLLSARMIVINAEPCALTIVRDITERKRAEAALRESRRTLFTLMSNLRGMAYRCRNDRDWTMEFVSQGALALTGYTADELTQSARISYAQVIHPDDRDAVWDAVQAALQARQPFQFVYRIVTTTGVENWVWEKGQGVFSEQGELLALEGFITDITERKRAEEAMARLNAGLEQRVKDRTADLRQASDELGESQRALTNLVEDLNERTLELEATNEKLKDLDQLKSLFIASMSHELRTPLNSIIGFSSILLDEWIGPLTAEQKENLAAVLRSGKHLLALINDVIDVTKIEAGKVEVVGEDFDLHDVFTEVATVMSNDIRNKGLELTVQADHIRLHTDRRRLLQCLLNLASNAVKFTERGAVSLCAGLGENRRTVEIAVRDTGIGMRAEDLGKLFLPFVRLDSPLRSKVLGTGLGLYLTRKLLTEVLKGEVFVSSVPGEGSQFLLRVPLSIEENKL